MVKEDYGPKLITVSPGRLTFDPPYGTRQSFNMKMTSHSSKTVAFKLETNHTMFYVVKPNQGLLKPKEKMVLAFELNEHFNQSAMETDRKDHRFRLRAVLWPHSRKNFHPDSLKTLLDESDAEHQMIILHVDIDRDNPTFVDLPPVVPHEEEEDEAPPAPVEKVDKFKVTVDESHGAVDISMPTSVALLIFMVLAFISGWVLQKQHASDPEALYNILLGNKVKDKDNDIEDLI